MPRKSSVEGDNGWYILIRAHDHVWRDKLANQLLWELSIKLLSTEAIIDLKKVVGCSDSATPI